MKKEKKVDDADIVAGFLHRDESAIKETQERYEKFIFSVCNSILRQSEDSEECVNTVYKKLWDTIPPQRPSDLKAYIARLCRTTSIDHLRSNRRLMRDHRLIDSLNDYADFLAVETSIEDEVNAHELADCLNTFLGRLKPNDRECFVKRYYFNRSVEEISEETHIPRSTVYAILKRIKNELKNTLIKEGFLS